MTDRELDDCECYDAMSLDNPDGMNKLVYLKAAISRLSYDYFIWVEPSTRFQREPRDLLKALRRSPLHVPLCRIWPRDKPHPKNHPLHRFMIDSGLPSEPYFGTSSFWIIQHQAVDLVSSTAVGFWRKAMDQGLTVDVDAALAFTMQLFCGAPRKHQWTENPALWLPRVSHLTLSNETLQSAAIVDVGSESSSADPNTAQPTPRSQETATTPEMTTDSIRLSMNGVFEEFPSDGSGLSP
jgi:hypothetical protein